jgi:protoporphyrin/coproporphyrin ferrochelatase
VTRHVILVTYGEPPDPGFVQQLVYSWRILLGLTLSVAPIPKYVLPLVALKRAIARNRMWSGEQYGSPLERITRNQADDMAEALHRLAPDQTWHVHVAYEFRDPLLSEMLRKLPPSEPVTIVPMYVAESAFTHEISRRTAELARRNGRAAPIRVLGPLDEETLAAILADHVVAEIERRGAGGADWALLLAAHGTLLTPPRPMETGREATERLALAVEERLRNRFGTIDIGWLNHVYGGKWTEPSVEEALVELWNTGYKRLVYFPFGFLADNAESELEGRIALRARSWIEMYHLPCVNDSQGLALALARQLRSVTP